jgi:hypothetical protein
MAVDLAKYVVSLEAQSRQYVAELEKANRKLDAFHRQQTTALDKISKGFRTLGIGISSALVVTAITRFATASLEMADNIGKVAKAADISAETLQKLRFAFDDLGGITAQQTDTALRKFNQTLGDAINGSKQAAATFQALGVAFVDSSGRAVRTEDALRNVLRELAEIESGAVRASRATDLFGRQVGPQLAAALSGGIAALDEAEAKLKGFITDENIEKAEQLRDEFERLSATIGGDLRNAIIGVTVDLAAMLGLVERTPLQNLKIELEEVERVIKNLQASAKSGALGGAGQKQAEALLNKELAHRADLLMQITQIERGSEAAANDRAEAQRKANQEQIEAAKGIQDAYLKSIDALQVGVDAKRLSGGPSGIEGMADINAVFAKADEARRKREEEYTRFLQEQHNIRTQQAVNAAWEEYGAVHEAKLQELQFRADLSNQIAALAHAVFGEHKAVQLAAIAFEKLVNVRRTKIAWDLAAVQAFQSQIIPGYPPSLATAFKAYYAVKARGAVAVGQAIAMNVLSGLTEAANVMQSNGALGSFTNPISTRTGATAAAGGTVAERGNQRVVEVHIGNLFGWDDYMKRQLIGAIREATEGKDLILFGRNSRQAEILRTP